MAICRREFRRWSLVLKHSRAYRIGAVPEGESRCRASRLNGEIQARLVFDPTDWALIKIPTKKNNAADEEGHKTR